MLVGAAILCLAGCGGNDELSLEEIEEKKGSFYAVTETFKFYKKGC